MTRSARSVQALPYLSTCACRIVELAISLVCLAKGVVVTIMNNYTITFVVFFWLCNEVFQKLCKFYTKLYIIITVMIPRGPRVRTTPRTSWSALSAGTTGSR